MKWIYVEGTQTIHKWVWAKSIEKNPTWTHTQFWKREIYLWIFGFKEWSGTSTYIYIVKYIIGYVCSKTRVSPVFTLIFYLYYKGINIIYE